MTTPGQLNAQWAYAMINTCVSQGITHYFISPGARSTPLTLAAYKHTHARTHIHYDERGVGYCALGCAKSTGIPTAIIVTSGTSVGNLLPAVMEAFHQHIPLVILSADRPPELRECGAAQTTRQIGIFSQFTKWHIDVPCPDITMPINYIHRLIHQAFCTSKTHPQGPVHINCMYRKPLYPDTPLDIKQHSLPHSISGNTYLDADQITHLAHKISQFENGIIITGSCNEPLDPAHIINLSTQLQWPIFGDILSPIRTYKEHPHILKHYECLIKAFSQLPPPDCILQIGTHITSQALLNWIADLNPRNYYHITNSTLYEDPTQSITCSITTSYNNFLSRILPLIHTHPYPSKWLKYWQYISAYTSENIHRYFSNHKNLCEPYIFYKLNNYLPDNLPIFISNSMNIRNSECFLFSKHSRSPIFANRGLCGIDGNLATLAGIAIGLNTPVLGLIGDLAFLHDMNSLALIKELPIILCVINNKGGDIFNALPITKHHPTAFTTPHTHTIKWAAHVFDIQYTLLEDLSQLPIYLESVTSAHMIEISTLQGNNIDTYSSLINALSIRKPPPLEMALL